MVIGGRWYLQRPQDVLVHVVPRDCVPPGVVFDKVIEVGCHYGNVQSAESVEESDVLCSHTEGCDVSPQRWHTPHSQEGEHAP